MDNSIYHSALIYNRLRRSGLCQLFSKIVIKHILAIMIAALTHGYRGKTTNFGDCSPCHRTTVAHFLNQGRWDDARLEDILKGSVVRAVSVMLSCNGLVLNYAVIMYDKTRSKIQIVQDIARELPAPPVPSFFLCDSWYTSSDVIHAFTESGFSVIGALKTDRVLYPAGYKMQAAGLATHMKGTMPSVHSVAVGKRQYRVYRYEGPINGIEKAVVLLSYPSNTFGDPAALRTFLCTDCSMGIEEILEAYTERWLVEVFFRESKQTLGLDQYQIRSSQGIRRFWLLMSLAHFICCTGSGQNVSLIFISVGQSTSL